MSSSISYHGPPAHVDEPVHGHQVHPRVGPAEARRDQVAAVIEGRSLWHAERLPARDVDVADGPLEAQRARPARGDALDLRAVHEARLDARPAHPYDRSHRR
jgi:hypothetical protein